MKKALSVILLGLLVSACNHVDKHYHYNSNHRSPSYQKYDNYRYNPNNHHYRRTVCRYETHYDAYGRRNIRKVCVSR